MRVPVTAVDGPPLATVMESSPLPSEKTPSRQHLLHDGAGGHVERDRPGCATIPVPPDTTPVPDAIAMLGVPNISEPSLLNLTHPVATATIPKSTAILILMSTLLVTRDLVQTRQR